MEQIDNKENKPIDYLSIVHFMFSFMVGYFNIVSLEVYIILCIIWEIGEHLFSLTEFSYTFEKYYPIPSRYWVEKIPNKMTDMVFNISGYLLGRYMMKKSILQ